LVHGGVMLIGAQWSPQLISTPSLPSKNPPFPAQPDPSPVQVRAAEAAPPQAALLSHTGPQDAATAASAASELTQLLQKMTGDIENLEQAMKQLKAKQDQIASDNAKAIEQLKTKQEDMARLLAKVSEQSALPKTSPPSAGPTQSPLARMQRRRHRRAGGTQYYDDEW
jgi:ABC-type transporter Mla subunit MlaD